MKKIFIILLISALPMFAADENTNGDKPSPIGVWENIDDKTGDAASHIELYEKDGIIYGKIVKLLKDPPDSRCDKCRGELKDMPVVGMDIVWGMKKYDTMWKGGRILDPANGKDYVCKMWVEDNGEKLKVRGYLAFFFRTQYWHRIK